MHPQDNTLAWLQVAIVTASQFTAQADLTSWPAVGCLAVVLLAVLWHKRTVDQG